VGAHQRRVQLPVRHLVGPFWMPPRASIELQNVVISKTLGTISFIQYIVFNKLFIILPLLKWCSCITYFLVNA
jgi:hypothetical protein